MDVLNEFLQTLRLRGALFFNGEFSSPWAFRSPEASRLAPVLQAEGQQVIIYHLVVAGKAWARIEGGDAVVAEAGDVVLFPRGHSHQMGHGAAVPQPGDRQAIEHLLEQRLEVTRLGGGGEVTRVVCGYLLCEPGSAERLFSGFPDLMRVRLRSGSGDGVGEAILDALTAAVRSGPGARAVATRLAEALFAETLRRYLEAAPEMGPGWLAGIRDPAVGRVLTRMHADAARRWTLVSLAGEAGLSRAVLAERFRTAVGQAPLAYLTGWRMHLAAQRLADGEESVAQVAAGVGYASEAAFHRAFQRHFGQTPAGYRRQSSIE